MTGKKSDSTPSLSRAERAQLVEELAYHEQAAASLESRAGMTDTYHHSRAAEIRAALVVTEEEHGKLD